MYRILHIETNIWLYWSLRHRPQETQKLSHPLSSILNCLCVADFGRRGDAEEALHRLVVNSDLCLEPLLHIEEFEIVEV